MGEAGMSIRNFARVMTVLAFGSLPGFAQNNCGATPPTGTCAAPAAPFQVWCAGNNSKSTCPGGTSKVGFYTTTPAAGSWSGSFEGLNAVSIVNEGAIVRVQPDPVGAVGPTNSSGVGQYLEVAGNFVQAFDRKTGNGILSTKPGTSTAPQPITGLFDPGGKNYCGNSTADAMATYDWIDGVFVLANTFDPGNAPTYYYCIGVSAPAGSVPANNLEGSASTSYWNTYAYNLTPALPKNSSGQVYFPDYERFGTWSDGFYVAWDLEDPNTNDVNIIGFEVCKLDKASMVAGLSSNPPVCYTYIPGYAFGSGGTDISLVHTLLPADFEGLNPIPADTAGEYFLAQVNPSSPGTNDQCTVAPCTSNQLAFWTWADFVAGSGPTMIPVSKPYTPGCYNLQHPFNTVCVQQPYGGYSDSVGDRLMHRLAYRNLSGALNGEYLAVTSTVEEDSTTLRTGVRYYQIAASASPSITALGDLQDNRYHLSVSMPSVAMDNNGNLGVTYTVTGKAPTSALNYDPSPGFITVTPKGATGPVELILSNSGTSGQDETDEFWGEYVSTNSDPNDGLTFWAVDEYMNGNQTSNCGSGVASGCRWATRIFTCKKGSGC
jgi:hypothetical protein